MHFHFTLCSNEAHITWGKVVCSPFINSPYPSQVPTLKFEISSKDKIYPSQRSIKTRFGLKLRELVITNELNKWITFFT